MLRLAADENFNNDIVRGIRRRNPGIDLVRVQDEGLSAADDPTHFRVDSPSEKSVAYPRCSDDDTLRV